jgi:hypothetical protein
LTGAPKRRPEESYLHDTSEVSILPPEVQYVQGYRFIDMLWKIMSIGMREWAYQS